MSRVTVNIVTPPVAESDIDLDLVNLTEFLTTSGAAERHAGGILGGEWGYGVAFENDTFLMAPYCWCERSDCPWCGSCSGGYDHPGHGSDCYQSRLNDIRAKYGERVDFGAGEFWTGYYGDKHYDRDRTALCREMGLDPEMGSEVHCTCGGDAEAKRRYDACQCDWHLGKGPFRFGPATQAPNFWHKPSGLQVRWYKWIGRDMEFSPSKPAAKRWRAIFDEVVASVPIPA